MWLLLLSVITLGKCDILSKNNTIERTASLIVLPPLVLGYEDLYDVKNDGDHGDPPLQSTNTPPTDMTQSDQLGNNEQSEVEKDMERRGHRHRTTLSLFDYMHWYEEN